MAKNTNIENLSQQIDSLVEADGSSFSILAQLVNLDIKRDLQGVDLSGTDLSGLDLSRADLRWTNLESAILDDADLTKTNLQGANIQGTTFHGSKLYGTNLSESNFYLADFSGADVKGAAFGMLSLSSLAEVETSPSDIHSDELSENENQNRDEGFSAKDNRNIAYHQSSGQLRPNIYSDSNTYENNIQVRVSINRLFELSTDLYPDPSPSVLTLRDFINRYRLTGLSQLTMEMISRSRRILLKSGNRRDISAGLFHTGLILFYFGHIFGAQQYFFTSRRYRSKENDFAWICLTHYAQGLAQLHAFMYEEAMANFEKAEKLISEIVVKSLTSGVMSFISQISQYLTESQDALNNTFHPNPPPPQKDNPNQASLNTDAFETAIQDSSVRYTWYMLEENIEDLPHNIQQGDLLLLDTQFSKQENIGSEDLALVRVEGSEIKTDNYLLADRTATIPSSSVHIRLKSIYPEGSFARDPVTGKVSITPGSASFMSETILGIIIGFWSQQRQSFIDLRK